MHKSGNLHYPIPETGCSCPYPTIYWLFCLYLIVCGSVIPHRHEEQHITLLSFNQGVLALDSLPQLWSKLKRCFCSLCFCHRPQPNPSLLTLMVRINVRVGSISQRAYICATALFQVLKSSSSFAFPASTFHCAPAVLVIWYNVHSRVVDVVYLPKT